jgi:hypothetical protein
VQKRIHMTHANVMSDFARMCHFSHILYFKEEFKYWCCFSHLIKDYVTNFNVMNGSIFSLVLRFVESVCRGIAL